MLYVINPYNVFESPYSGQGGEIENPFPLQYWVSDSNPCYADNYIEILQPIG